MAGASTRSSQRSYRSRSGRKRSAPGSPPFAAPEGQGGSSSDAGSSPARLRGGWSQARRRGVSGTRVAAGRRHQRSAATSRPPTSASAGYTTPNIDSGSSVRRRAQRDDAERQIGAPPFGSSG